MLESQRIVIKFMWQDLFKTTGVICVLKFFLKVAVYLSLLSILLEMKCLS